MPIWPDHSGYYRWSSYRFNALGQRDSLVIPHVLYHALGRTTAEQQARYRDLFAVNIDSKTLSEIREATQKGWALGNDRFKDEIEAQLKRHTRPLARGGDHRSLVFRTRQR